MQPESTLLFGPGQKIVFIGDSITDCGRRGPNAPWGEGYVSLVNALLAARYPDLNLEVVNRGIGGDTIRHLARRWEQDVIAERPDWLSVQIGVNDVAHPFFGNDAAGVLLDEYERTYRRLLQDVAARAAARVIVMEPFVLALPEATGARVPAAGPLPGVQRLLSQFAPAARRRSGKLRRTAQLRTLLDEYGGAVQRLADEFGAVLVRTQAAFDQAMAARPAALWSDRHDDGIHPGLAGHAVIARCFLRATGYGDI